MFDTVVSLVHFTILDSVGRFKLNVDRLGRLAHTLVRQW